MSSKLIKKKYNPYLTGRRNYFNLGGLFGKIFNGTLPLDDIYGTTTLKPSTNTNNSVQNGKKPMSTKDALLGASAMTGGSMIGGLLSGGKSSTAGNLVGGLGTGIGGMVSTVNPLLGMGIVGGSQVLEGAIDALWGSDIDWAKVDNIKSQILQANQFTSDLNSFDSLAADWNRHSVGLFSQDAIGSDGVFSSKASDLFNELQRDRDLAQLRVQLELMANASRIQSDQNITMQKNYAAFGGKLGTNGADFDLGLIQINNGGTHETSPFGGIMMGTDDLGVPNMVEMGETIWKDYVFSNRMKVPKGMRAKYKLKDDVTFAEASKILSKEAEERPNDPISKNGLIAGMSELATALEALRQRNQKGLLNQFAHGGKMGNYFDGTGNKPNQLFLDNPNGYLGQLLGFATNSEYQKWLKDNNIEDAPATIDDLAQSLDVNSPSYQTGLDSFKGIALKKNPQLYHAMTLGYDPFKVTTMSTPANLTFDFKRGGWGSEGYDAWKGSSDPAWIEATTGYTGDGSDFNVAQRLLATQAYQRGTKWLQDSEENRRLYLQQIVNSNDAPQAAKNYALKYIDLQGAWLPNAVKDYNTIFGTVRTTHPGTFWKTPPEMLGTDQSLDFAVGEDGSIEQLYNTTGYDRQGSYTWGNETGNSTYNYYTKTPVATPAPATDNSRLTDVADDNYELDYPNIDDPLRYAPIIGSAIGLGATLFSKPDYSEAQSIMEVANNARYTPVSFTPIGDYLTYKPLDRDYYLNQMNALAGATRRNIMNTSGGNRGLAMSGLLAADYNALAGVGDTLFKMDTYNNEQKAKVLEFNRATNTTNSQGFLLADMANQTALANYRDFNLRAVTAAAELRSRERMARENAISQGITGLFDNLGAIGEQNVTNAMVKWADEHGVTAPSYRKKKKGTQYSG